jgi:hypothetical protein
MTDLIVERLDCIEEKLDRLTDMVGQHHEWCIFAFQAVFERFGELLGYGRNERFHPDRVLELLDDSARISWEDEKALQAAT